MKTPCQGCSKRIVGCHGSCPDYKAYREELGAYRKKERKDADFFRYIKERQTFYKKGKNQ